MRLLLAILLAIQTLLAASTASAQQSQGMSQAMVVSSCGGGALPSGALNQLTMDTTGRLCQSGIGSNACPQAAAYLARTTGGNEGGNAVNITALICGLVTDGVIDGDLLTGKCGSHLDALYVLAQQNQADALLNLCGTSYSLAPTSSPPFTTYKGFGPFNAASSYLDTGFSATGASSPHFVQNSGNIGVWPYATTANNTGFDIGNDTSVFNLSEVVPYYNNVGFYGRINDSTAANITSPGTKGLFVADRSSSANVVLYWNGTAQSTQPSTSNAPLGANFYIGNAGASGATLNTLCEAHIGGSLGATLNLALYNRLRTYLTAVGVP